MATKKTAKATKPAAKKAAAKPKRPRDVNQLAHFLVQATTEREAETPESPAVTSSEISRVMAELGRRGGKVGGRKRAENLTAKKRHQIAVTAAKARWAGSDKIKNVKPTKAKAKTGTSNAEFVRQFTDLTEKHLSTLQPVEQKKRLNAAERRLDATRRDARSTASYTEETSATRLEARNHHE
jgi:hypothetical protein